MHIAARQQLRSPAARDRPPSIQQVTLGRIVECDIDVLLGDQKAHLLLAVERS